MRINYLCCEWSLDLFAPRLIKKYNFMRYNHEKHKGEAVVFFGCYGIGTKRWVMNHRALTVIVWSGSDTTRLHEYKDFVDHCKLNSNRVIHIAHSHWIQTDLKHWGLDYIDKVVLPADLSQFKYEPEPGSNVYHYGSKQREWYYGSHLMRKLRTKWNGVGKFPDVVITNAGGYGFDELYEIYKGSFIGVRLTEHDNMALSCIELGLMGRYSIFNGNIPCAIPYGQNYTHYEPMTRKGWVWQDEGLLGVVENMIIERLGIRPDRLLAEEMREFVYDDEKWLDTKAYE